MNWLLVRVAIIALATLAAAAFGEFIGELFGRPFIGVFAGVACGAMLVGLLDGLRARRLLNWLRRGSDGDAPRGVGMWGEFGYRIDKALRLRDRAEQRERQRLQNFLAAIEASPNGVMMVGAAEQIEWMSRVAAEHFGLDPQRDRLQRVTNLVRAPAFVAYLHGGQFDEPIAMTGPDGRRSLSVLVRPYGDGAKLVLSQDVTERERNDGMRRDFVANVSHEIRTPLTVLAGFVETMATLPLGPDDRERMLQLMTQQTRRMQTLVTDLLTLARLEGSPQPAPDDWHPVADLIEQIGVETQGLSRGRHLIRLPETGGADLAGVELAGNLSELLSAMTNLASNAVRYTPDEGRISIGWQLRPGGGAVFEVKDSGIGIARDHLPRLTERFYRIDGSRSRETGGTGLGLSIVKHVVQRHGAELTIDSQIGQGSTFRILFPASRVRVHRAVAEAAQAQELRR